MFQHINTTIPAATGTFETLVSDQPRATADAIGKSPSTAGKALPISVPEAKPDFEKIVQRLNVANLSVARDLRFQVDLKSGNAIIQVFDSETGELIRQIPAEKVSNYLQSGGSLAIPLFDELA